MDKQKILIVDDNPDIRLGMHLRLKANQYETFLAGDALSAVTEAQERRPDLILLALGLPAGDGFTVMESLKKIPFLAAIPIIVVSARDSPANKERAYAAGATAYLQKPVNDAEMLAVIRQALGELVGTSKPTLYDQESV